MVTRIQADISEVRSAMGILQVTLERGLRGAVRNWLMQVMRQSFKQRSSPEGQPWAPLSAAWNRTPQRHGTAALSKSIYAIIKGKTIEAGSHVPFSSFYQEGASYPELIITPKAGHKALRYFSGGRVFGPFMAGGGGPVFGTRFKIPARKLPARPFVPSPAFAERGAVEIINQEIAGALDRSRNA